MIIFQHLRFSKFFVKFCTEKSVLMRYIYWESVLKNNILLYAWKRSIITLDMNERERDMQLADKLWREYEPYIRKLCNYKLNRHKEYIDDCVQDVFAALVEAIHKGTKIEYPKTWLTTVTNNMIKDIYSLASKTSDKVISLSEKDLIDDNYFWNDTAFENSNISEEQILSVKEEIIQMLNEDEQLLLNERFEQKLSIAFIARRYNTTENNIYQKLFRLRSKCRKLIRDYLEQQY